MDIAALKEAAEKATPGPWHNSHGSVDNFGNEWQGSLSFEWSPNGTDNGDGINDNFVNDGQYIALANPTAILSLIGRVAALEDALRLFVEDAEEDANILPSEQYRLKLGRAALSPTNTQADE